ncbi:hypothetical protein [Sodalis ligni]|uniref:hypothetical protein n=1 Tax=Sodalis ligni TaxID=2697027 RepID=UPI0020971A20|nr:hypothetical protein [Sodalis ligni]
MRLPLFDETSLLEKTAHAPALSALRPGLFYTAVEQSSVAISITDPRRTLSTPTWLSVS